MSFINNEHCKICATKLCCFCSYNNNKENTKKYKSIWKFNY